jgi:hypothetical protein
MRLDYVEELKDHSRDTTKVAGPLLTAQVLRDLFHIDEGRLRDLRGNAVPLLDASYDRGHFTAKMGGRSQRSAADCG